MTMRDFREALQDGILLFDGAMGTMLQQRGLDPGDPPEKALVENFDLVAEIHGRYADAGAEIITTNSFGANSVKIVEFGMEDRFEEINRLAVRAAKKLTEGAYVAGDMGPTGKFLEPVGDLSWDDAVDVFRAQALILADEGVDLFIIETMSDLRELKAAVYAAKSVGDLPVVAMMTFDESGRSTLGTPPEAAAVVMEAMGVDVAGSNCSVGPEGILKWLESMRPVVSTPLVAMPNAGLPRLEDGKTVFPLGPESMAEWVEKFIDVGCGLIGSCCGSTPDHTRALSSELDRIGRSRRVLAKDSRDVLTTLASRTKVVSFGPGAATVAVGERINPTGRKEFAKELENGDLTRVRNEARIQENAGVDMVDLNVGVPGVNEAELLREAVMAAESSSSLPIVLDSADHEAIESALKVCAGKPLINSVKGERKSLKIILPLARKYGAAVLGLCMDETGVPENAKDRVRIARKIIKAAQKAGVEERDVLLDPVTVPVSAKKEQAREALDSLKYFTDKLGRGTLQGISNISFGLPRRGALNASYLAMAIEAGLSATFLNPLDKRVMEIFYASRVLAGKDFGAGDYIAFDKKTGGAQSEPEGRSSAENREALSWEEALKAAVIEGEDDKAVAIVEAKLAEGTSPMEIGERAMMPGIGEVGRLYESGEIYLPNLMLSARAMERGMELINGAIEKNAGKVVPKGTVVIATVEGDIHDIGKNIVATVMRTNGWNVVDLGKGVSNERIIESALKENADVVALSALMTTTVVKMPEAIEKLHGEGVPVIVGGAVLTAEYAGKIGADFYGKDAVGALRGAEKIIKNTR